MKSNEELIDMLVLVHPAFFNDPAQNQNKIGMITSADLDRDDIFVTFGKEEPNLYSTDALLVLKSVDDIHWSAVDNNQQMDTADFKSLLSISMLGRTGTYSDTRRALEMIVNNNRLVEHSTVSLDQALGLELAPTMQR